MSKQTDWSPKAHLANNPKEPKWVKLGHSAPITYTDYTDWLVKLYT